MEGIRLYNKGCIELIRTPAIMAEGGNLDESGKSERE